MKITKFVHACLLVETPVRAALFDPGVYAEAALNVELLMELDDIFITHVHADHMSVDLIKALRQKFPDVRITAPKEVTLVLEQAGITGASTVAPEGASIFESPHESVKALFGSDPEEIGVHYLDTLSHPGDSHSFHETKTILALPVQAPWGSTVRAVEVALVLKPQHILPIHDWHWSDTAREQMYGVLEKLFETQGITFYKLQTGMPVTIDV